MSEHGPFQTEREAMSTRAAARLRAACDANPGAWKAEHLKLMTDACEAAGVELGAFDLAPFRQLAMYETFNAVVIAAVIRRAFEAGQAAGPDGTVTEYGVRFTLAGSVEEVAVAGEDAAKRAVESMRENHPDFEPVVMVQREAARPAGPWTPVPEEGGEPRECRHCSDPIRRCASSCSAAPDYPLCKGWRHVGYDDQPVIGHCCEGRSINPAAEPREDEGNG